MNIYSLAHDFSIANLPNCVSQQHRNDFDAVLRQRQAGDDALQDALGLESDLGTAPRGAGQRRLRDAWAWHREEEATYEAMLQDAMERLDDDYPHGFGDACR